MRFAHAQYMELGSLRTQLDSPEMWAQFTPAMRDQVIMDVAEGMAFLHERNVFHRDLKG